jgi:hypothetical protein
MTSRQEKEQIASGSNLLTSQEQAICKQIATSEGLHSQRALALLALDKRSTQALAAKQAGLSMGQVRYLIAQFRKRRVGIFPDTLLLELDAEAEKPESVTEKEDKTEDNTMGKKSKKKKEKKVEKKSRKAEKRAASRAAKKAARRAAKAAKKAKKAAKKAKKAAKRARKAEMKARKLNRG